MTDEKSNTKPQLEPGTVYIIEGENRSLGLVRALFYHDVGTVQNGHDIVYGSTCQAVAGYKLQRR